MNELKKINELKTSVGAEKVNEVINQVPIKNIYVAVTNVPMKNLIEIFKEVSVPQLIKGLKVIKSNQIKKVPINKLRIILVYGDMETVSKLQEYYTEDMIIKALNGFSEIQLKELMQNTDIETIKNNIDTFLGIIPE